jgi:hypothetical protein
LTAWLLVVAPLPLIVMNSYGGEMLFRVYFYALPFTAFLAAALVFPSAIDGRSPWTAPIIAGLSLVLLGGFVFSYYGKDSQYYFSPNEVAAAQYVNRSAPHDALIVDGSWDWPLQYHDYEYYNYFSLASLDINDRRVLLADPVGTLYHLMSDPKYPTAFLIITSSQKEHVDQTGLMPAGSLSAIVAALRASPGFKIAFENPSAVVFTLSGRGP